MRKWLLAFLPLLGGCLGSPEELVGRYYDVEESRFIDEPRAFAKLAGARFVVLGEQHDNREHHRVQARVVGDLAARGRRPVVAFEMFATDRDADLARHQRDKPGDTAGLSAAGGWDSGWSAWADYQPIVEAAFAGGMTVVAANAPRGLVRDFSRRGAEALAPERFVRLGLDRPLATEVVAALRIELAESHCHVLPDRALDGMVRVQRLWDAVMAESLIAAASADGAVLITGNGHARKDRGVPAQLARQAPGATVTSLGLIEIEPEKANPADYARRYQGARPPFDIVFFTRSPPRKDPCKAFRESRQPADGPSAPAPGEGRS